MTIRTNVNHHSITNGQTTAQPASPNINSAAVSAATRPPGIPARGHGQAQGQGQGQLPQPQQQQQQQQQDTVVDETPEQVLLASFKAAALSVTQLYKDSLKNQRAEHAKGYEAALQDLLAFIANHPVVQEKKDHGMTEDEIRQNTSLSIDDIVQFISNARSANCNDLHLQQQQQQQQQQMHAQAQQAHEQQQLHQQQLLHQQQQQQQEQQQQQQFLHQQQQHHTMEQQQQLQQQQQLHLQQQHQEQHQQQQLQHQQTPGSNGITGGGPRMSSSTTTTPSSIFPSDAFTFTAPIFHSGLGGGQSAFQSMFPGPEGGIGQQMAVDSLKRRYALQEFSVAASRMAGTNNNRMQTPLNLNVNVNMDSFGAFHDQPPFKRGRRREGE